METEPRTRSSKAPPERFVGDAWVDVIAAPHTDDQRMTVATVRFAPGARTAWHSHARGQYLRVPSPTAPERGGHEGLRPAKNSRNGLTMTRIGISDLDVSALCLGGNTFGWTSDRDTSFAVLDAYADGNFVCCRGLFREC